MTDSDPHTDGDTFPPQEHIETQRDEVLSVVQRHLGKFTSILASLRAEEYGELKIPTSSGEYVVKHEDGSPQWFRWEPEAGNTVYIISARSTPSPVEVIDGLEEYQEFVSGFNKWVDAQSTALDTVEDSLSESAEQVAQLDATSLIARRDETAEECWDIAHELAGILHSVTGNSYATFETSLDDELWTLKCTDSQAKYLRVGGTYILGRDQPSPQSLGKLIEHFDEFIEEFDQWLTGQRDAVDEDVPTLSVEGGLV